MTLTEPAWLLLAIPLGIAFWRWRPANRLLRVLRVAIFVALVLALSGIAIEKPSRAGVVIVVADRSVSMPRDADKQQREVIAALESKRRGDSRLGVVSFGRGANVELSPDGGRFSTFHSQNAADGSELHEGLQTALSLIPRDTPGRVVIVSDGRWTGRDPSAAALAAADRGVAVDYRVVSRGGAGDLAVERFDVPSTVSPGESFVLGATIRSPAEQTVNIELLRGSSVIARGEHRLTSGSNRIAFRDRAGSGSTLAYSLRLATPEGDPLPENNSARALVGVRGPKPLLVVTGTPGSRFASLLAAGGLETESSERLDASLETLSKYSAVILENLPTQNIGANGMQSLATWVTDGAGALMFTGGPSAYAAGGYFKSPLEPIMPLSMELRREHRKLNLSIVVALDRSGSMAMPAGGGKVKMDLANLGAAEVLSLLGPEDELGIVAVDSSSHIIADLDPIAGRADLRERILGIESAGGGIFVFEALSTASRMLLTARSRTRHIILFADAADAEEPGDYQNLLAQCQRANITVSVIGLGLPDDVDADLLRDIARRGNGRIFFTNDPGDLPRLFAQDTFVVARSSLIEQQTAIRPTGALFSLTGRNFASLPPLGGYNLSYLRDGASASVLTTDEYKAPVVASWQAGLGRVLAYAGEADGDLTGPMGRWGEVGTFYTSLARWTAGAATSLPDDMLITQRVENGVAKIDLQLDPERTSSSLTHLPRITTLAAVPGGVPVATRSELRWRTPDQLSIEVPLTGAATYLSTVEVPGAGRVTLAPVCLPYSPEHAPADEGEGRAALDRLARMTGGKERLAAGEVWRDLPRQPRLIPLRIWLILLAILLLLIETLERRTRLVTSFAMPDFSPVSERLARMRPTRVRAPKPVVPTAVAPPPPEPPPAPAAEADTALLDALKRAGTRAKRKL